MKVNINTEYTADRLTAVKAKKVWQWAGRFRRSLLVLSLILASIPIFKRLLL